MVVFFYIGGVIVDHHCESFSPYNSSIIAKTYLKVKTKLNRKCIENDIYIINDLLDQNKQTMSFEIIQDTYHVETTFIKFCSVVSVIPRHRKHLISTCHSLRYKGNKLQIDSKTQCFEVEVIVSFC